MAYELPVSINFRTDQEGQIGRLTIFDDKFKIPFESVFSLAGKIKPDGEVEITQISLVPDSVYLEYYEKDLANDKKLIAKLKAKAKMPDPKTAGSKPTVDLKNPQQKGGKTKKK